MTKGGRIKERFKTQPCVDILFLLGIIRWKNDNKDIFFPKEIYSCFIMLNILNLKVYRQKNRFKQQKYTLSSDSVYHVGYFNSFHSLLSWTEKNNLMHVWSIQFLPFVTEVNRKNNRPLRSLYPSSNLTFNLEFRQKMHNRIEIEWKWRGL